MMLASQHGRSGGCTDGRRGCGCGTVWTRGYRRRSSRGGSDQRADDPPVDRAGHLDRDLAVGPARYSARSAGAAQAGSVQPYNPIIDARLAVFPCCPRRLFDEVCVAGYAGGYGRVRDYVRMVPPCEPAEPWSLRDAPGPPGTGGLREFTLPWGRHHALLVLLGHSRPTYCGCVSPPTDDGRPLIDGLESAFERFGGVC